MSEEHAKITTEEVIDLIFGQIAGCKYGREAPPDAMHGIRVMLEKCAESMTPQAMWTAFQMGRKFGRYGAVSKHKRDTAFFTDAKDGFVSPDEYEMPKKGDKDE